MKEVFKSLKKETHQSEYNKYNLRDKIQLFKLVIEDMCDEGSKIKLIYKPVIKNLLETVEKIATENKQLKESQESDKMKIVNYENQLKQPKPNDNQPKKYESYAKATKNEKKQNLIIVKKLEKSEQNGNLHTDEFDLKAETMKKLREIEDDIDVTKIQVRNDNVIINTRDEHQLELIKNALEKENKLKADKPTPRIPSIIIKEIDKELTEEQVIEQICKKNGIKREDCKVKKFINDGNFHTNRMLINFRLEDTKRIIDQEHVRIGFMLCPVEARYKITQCHCCLKFGHRHKDVNGKITCRSNAQKCSHCAGDHKFEDCQDKNDKNKAKCVNCNGKHRSTDGRCEKKKEVTEKVKSKCIH